MPASPLTRPARTFWWDRARPAQADVLGAVIFDAEAALADLERDGHRVAYNAAFAQHGIDISWSVEEYGRLLRIPSGRRRVETELTARGFGAAADLIATRVYRTKSALFEDCVLDADIAPKSGLIDLVMSLFVAGIWVGVVSTRGRAWAETLVRQLVGEGLVETIVTSDDLPQAQQGRDVELYRLALWELGIAPEAALAVAGSARGLGAALAGGLPAVVVTSEYTADQVLTGAAAVRTAYDGPDPLLAVSCQRLHRRWWIDKLSCCEASR